MGIKARVLAVPSTPTTEGTPEMTRKAYILCWQRHNIIHMYCTLYLLYGVLVHSI